MNILASSVEVLQFELPTMRAKAALQSFYLKVRPPAARYTHTYQGESDWLMLWGPGAPNRWPAMAAQLEIAGRHVICCDLAYWDRNRKVRISIDAPHPAKWVMRRDWPTTRVRADGIRRGACWDAKGPILVAGIGEKAKVQYGGAVQDWEAEMMQACERRWPGRRILYRPKPKAPPEQIDGALQGVSLVITWHSNVAVDAIRMGVPVVCKDGAAAAVCPAELPAVVAPLSTDLTDRFLANLAWFQWDPMTEAGACWAWLQELLS